MQRDPRFLAGKATVDGYDLGNITHNTPMGGHYTYGPQLTPAVGLALEGNQEVPSLLDRFEFQPYENCPKNFVIFDRTDNRSRVMFHPTLAHKLSYPKSNILATMTHDDGKGIDRKNENNDTFSSLLKEDTKDIDALLSYDEDKEEDDDDVVSTDRTPGSWGGSSPDSSYSVKMKSASREPFSGSPSSKSKREQMREMVEALRRIIPGGESMDTLTIFNEAVVYLKSLKAEVEKLGI